MTLYVPNSGEKEMLKNHLVSEAWILMLYKNLVSPDGSLTMDSLTELATGGGETYAQIPLTNKVVENAPTAGAWYISLDSNGRAQAQYGLPASPQAWTFGAQDVTDNQTAYGIGIFTYVLPFTAGVLEIKVGDVIKGVTSGATGIVTGIEVQSGSWGAAAVGNLKIMSKSATAFQNAEYLTILGAIGTVSVGSTGSGGSGYVVGDLSSVTQSGGAGAILRVTSLGTDNVTGWGIVAAGHGFTVANNLPTVALTGGGSDATVNILTEAATAYATTATGSTGDALKKLLGTEAFSAGNPITLLGQTIAYQPILTYSSSS